MDMNLLVFLTLLGVVYGGLRGRRQRRADDSCLSVSTIDTGLRELFCNQPVFFNFIPKTEENQLIDNICVTAFPLPDDPDTFHLYTARVYCDGSVDIESNIATQISTGVYRRANPFDTATVSIFGYAGCETYLLYACDNFGVSEVENFVFGVSKECRSVGLSCLRKIEEIIADQCLPEVDMYVLPMKLPNRCVTQQLCVQPPNPFYNQLPGVQSYYY